MKRRDFIKTGAVAAGLAGSLKLLPSLMASESDSQKPSGKTPGDNRSADYLRRAQEDKFLPMPPVFADSYQPDAVQISPMPGRSVANGQLTTLRRGCGSVTTSALIVVLPVLVTR